MAPPGGRLGGLRLCAGQERAILGSQLADGLDLALVRLRTETTPWRVPPRALGGAGAGGSEGD